tara:strand:- start:18348 stop:19109 length:762 start_codon:yes stop_codon:yes gene_type:complete
MNTQSKPLVTIITVVLNGEKFIEDAIKSVMNQTYKNIEYIILDGKSVDKTIDIIKKYEEFITFFESNKDNGLYSAINKGIKISSGEFIKILNSDDKLHPEAIEKNIDLFMKEDNLNHNFVVNSYLERIDLNGKRLAIWDNKGKIINGYEQFLHPSWLVPKRIYEDNGLYNEEYKVSADYEYYLRLKSKKINFRTIQIPLVSFRPGGISYGFKGMKEDLDINLKYFNFIISYWHYVKNVGFKTLKLIKDSIFQR